MSNKTINKEREKGKRKEKKNHKNKEYIAE